jgi:hypothetical protein
LKIEYLSCSRCASPSGFRLLASISRRDIGA